ncbi:hypothetical protein F5X99DRAFT_357064 [Biscogniauxia marginata]|nr:hypothetical protein F5X99DRAFT_357064 [Biscogniauxia marginata]
MEACRTFTIPSLIRKRLQRVPTVQLGSRFTCTRRKVRQSAGPSGLGCWSRTLSSAMGSLFAIMLTPLVHYWTDHQLMAIASLVIGFMIVFVLVRQLNFLGFNTPSYMFVIIETWTWLEKGNSWLYEDLSYISKLIPFANGFAFLPKTEQAGHLEPYSGVASGIQLHTYVLRQGRRSPGR